MLVYMVSFYNQFLFNCAFTIVVETLVFIFIVRSSFKISKEKLSLSRLILGGLFASSITIPWVWFVFPYFFSNTLILALAAGEFFAFAVEAVFYRSMFEMPWRRSIIISLACNASSYFLGLLVAVALHAPVI